ncbi:MAG TPA: hypothetical protein VGL99_31935 [Chloroflexota bacterium]
MPRRHDRVCGVFGSTFLPRTVGVLLAIGTLCYLMWLLIAGVNIQCWNTLANASRPPTIR